MIIDMHRHMWSLYERYPVARELAIRSGSQGFISTTVRPIPLVPDTDDAANMIISMMDEAGIDKSLVFLADYGLRLGEGVLSVEGENRIHADLAHKHPDRLMAFVGVDPRRPGALELLRRGVDEWGMKGWKMHPTVGYFPNDRVCYPLYELCSARGVPIVSHTGPMASPLYSKYSQPMHLDDVATDFPDLTIIMAHAGQAWWPEALNIARTKGNVYLDLSMWQWEAKYPEQFVAALARMRDTIGAERMIFGSDFPGLRRAMELKPWVQTFQDLPALAKRYGYSFNSAEVDAIMCGNAQRLLKLG